MPRPSTPLLAAALATALTATAAFVHAQPDARRAGPMRLDANADGAIDRAEAVVAPRLAARFDALDADRDGRLERGEFRGRHGRDGQRDPAALDVDRDGRLSRAEVAAQPRLAEDFDAIDRNRDGALVRSELVAHRERMRAQRRAEGAKRFDARFAAADTNRDGRLSRGEIEAGMPKLADRFAFYDENRDGYLTREDLRPRTR